MLPSIKFIIEKWYVLLLMWAVGYAESGLRCPPATSNAECSFEVSAKTGNNEDEFSFHIKEVNRLSITIAKNPDTFRLTCPENVTLESEFLPAFDELETINYVTLMECPVPSTSYTEVLLSLNISVSSTLDLILLGNNVLEAKHFESLTISELIIKNSTWSTPSLITTKPLFLQLLPDLKKLRLTGVPLDAADVQILPSTLEVLKLYNTSVRELPPEMFKRLNRLKALFVQEKHLTSVNLSLALNLSVAEITAPVDGVTLGPALNTLTLSGAVGLELRGCVNLSTLQVIGGNGSLPNGWLRGCPINKVTISGSHPSAGGEWHGADKLETLDMHDCELRNLPENWLRDVTNLKDLKFQASNISSLPRKLFDNTKRLKRLNLENNKLRGVDVKDALGLLSNLTSLSLANNPTLGPLCEFDSQYTVYGQESILRDLKTLQTLYLNNTGATSLCRDWRTELLQLRELDLRTNNISELRYYDTLWKRKGNVSVKLNMTGYNVTSLTYTEQDYRTVVDGTAASTALQTLDANWALYCDCTQYWLARALRERPWHAPLNSTRCESGELLMEQPLDSFTCALPADKCLEGCACVASPVHTRVSCAGAGLTGLPRVADHTREHGLPPVTELRLAGNNITLRLQDLAQVPNVTVLDLSNNSISTIDAETVAALFPEGRRVLLAGNPLSCGCDASALLRAVAERPKRVDEAARCADGTRLHDAAQDVAVVCAPSPAWPFAFVAILLLPTALLTGVLARPAVRARLKLFLFERGLCLRWVLPPDMDDDGSRPYDAFVSFSHRDAAYAAEMARQLESAGRRLCLHERDWTPGEWIPTQIARSVREARRTVVLVSEHFLRSEWARLELREAYSAALGEARPRLLVVLLPGCAPAAAGAAAPELQAYLAAVTYLLWDDPHFWRRLHMALPPRAAATPPPPLDPLSKPTAAAA